MESEQFTKYLLSTKSVPETVQGTVDVALADVRLVKLNCGLFIDTYRFHEDGTKSD